MGIADYLTYSGKRGNFFRRALRVTPGDNDSRFWIRSMDSSNRRACVLICSRRHRTRIQYHHVRSVFRGGALQSLIQELAFQGGAVGLCRSTAKIFYVEAAHTSILAQIGGIVCRPAPVDALIRGIC